MAVGTHHSVGVGHAIAGRHDAGQVLEIDLVHDPGAGWHHSELVEGALAPPQELVSLPVSLVLQLDVALEGVRAGEHVSDH